MKNAILLLAVCCALGLSMFAQAKDAATKPADANEDFRKNWKPMPDHGKWEVVSAREVRQLLDGKNAPKAKHLGNTGFTRILEQSGTMEYEWTVLMAQLDSGCGLYLFATDPMKEERGDGYEMWLGGKADVTFALTKIINNAAPKELAKFPTDAKAGKAVALKVRYDSDEGQFTLWCNGAQLGEYKDPEPYKKGSCVSLTTCMTVGAFKDMKITRVSASTSQPAQGAGK